MVDRRSFLKWGAVTATGAPVLAVNDARAEAAETLKKGGQDFNYLSGTELDSKPTACALCASRCAAIAYTDGGYIVKVEGQPESKRTLGRLCAKGQAGRTQVYDPDRILKPMRRTGKRGDGKWRQVSWDEALDELTGRLKTLKDNGEPEKFMFHYGWVSASADALINKVFLPSYGTATIADNSCLGQSARLLSHELTWGGHEDSWDFDNTRYILNFGSNVVEAHTNHVALSRRLSFALTDRNVRMVTFDVRLSNTASKSNAWYQLRPGTDAAVALAMCHVIMAEKLYNEEFLGYCLVTPDHNASLEDKVAALNMYLESYTPEWAEEISGVNAQDISTIAVEFAKARPGCIISSRGATAHYNGVDTERAIQMLAALTGNIDNPGGRCMGVAPEWNYPAGPDNKPDPRHLDIIHGPAGEVAIPVHGVGHQVLRMIRDGSAGRPDVYMWYNYNPVFSNGNCQENIDILKDEALLPFTVAVTPFYDESAVLADLILPDAVYLEKFDFETGVSPTQVPEYYIRQPVVEPQGEARDFKDVCCDLAKRLDIDLGIESAEDFLQQSCELTPAVNDKAGGFSGMKRWGLWYDKTATPRYYSYRQPVNEDELKQDGVILDEASGVYWNWKLAGVNNAGDARRQGYRSTPEAYKGYVAQQVGNNAVTGFAPDSINKSGLFELYSPVLEALGLSPLPEYKAIPEHKDLENGELILTTFRVNVQTLSRTQNCRWLDEINGDNPAWINTQTAMDRGINEGDRIILKTSLGQVETIAKVTENVVPGVIAISAHGGRWEYGRYASGKKAPFSMEEDTPHEQFKWWKYGTIHPNWIINNVAEPVSGQQRWMDTVVTVIKA